MITDLQKASILKRISAAIFDGMLLSILVVLIANLLSSALGYSGHIDTLNKAYTQYETQFGVEFQITQETYDALPEAQRQNYDAAYQALIGDDNVLYTYNTLIHLTILILTFSFLISIAATEFVIPLFLKNGQTLGKKFFGIGVIRTDGVCISNMQLFVRAILGKFTIELMIPIYIIIMIFLKALGLLGVILLAALLLGQIICIAATRTNAMIHDILASTVTVDLASQMIFQNKEELLEYTKKLHAERAARSDY